MKEVYVIDGARTPFGAFGGGLSEIEAPGLASVAIQAILQKTGLSPGAVDEVILGQVLGAGSRQGPARQAMRDAGLPDSTNALTINKLCGSGLKAIMLGADSIRLGESEVVLAGGMENMSLAPFLLKKGRFGYRLGHGEVFDAMLHDALLDPDVGCHMGDFAESSAERHGLGRKEQDEYAVRSFTLARQAVDDGILDEEIAPVTIRKKGREEVLARDEGPFKGDLDKLGDLRPAFRKDGTITAGNASTINDGAALVLLAGNEAVERHGLEPKARIVASATASMAPECFPEAPVLAIEKVCAKAGLSKSDIDLFEINEAFAAVALLAIRELELPMDKVNVNGGACALGHPIGASGGRLAVTLVRELRRRRLQYGLATLCIGGGEAVATIFERL